MISGKRTAVTTVIGILVTITLGMFYAWSVFIIPLTEQFDKSVSEVSSVYTIQMLSFCAGGVINGRFQNKGSRLALTMSISALLMGCGFIMNGLAGSLTSIYISYGILFAMGVGIGYGSVLNAVVGWFPEKKGFFTGILLMGYGTGSLIWSTLCTGLMESAGLRSIFIAIGIVFIIVIGGGGLILDNFNERIKALKDRQSDDGERISSVAVDMKPSQMIKTPIFYLFYLWLFFYAVCGQAFISNISPMAVSLGGAGMTAAVIVGVTAVFNGFGRIIIGAMLDRIKMTVMMLVLSLYLVCMLTVLMTAMKTGNLVLFTIGALGMGISFSGIPISMAIFVADTWGMKYYASNYSVANTNMIPQSLIGVMLFTKIVGNTGSYIDGFWLLMLFAVLLVISTVLIMKVRKNEQDI